MLLQRDSNQTERKMVESIRSIVDELKSVSDELCQERESLAFKLKGTLMATNRAVNKIKGLLGLENVELFINKIDGIDELMVGFGFRIEENPSMEYKRSYTRGNWTQGEEKLLLRKELFEEDSIKNIRRLSELEDLIIWEGQEFDGLPF